MANQTNPIVKARIPADLKCKVEAALEREGLTAQKAIEILWREIGERGGFPWEIKAPHKADAAE